MKITLTKQECATIRAALDEAIRDREGYVDAYTPRFGKPNPDAARIIRQTRRHITQIQKVMDKFIWSKEPK